MTTFISNSKSGYNSGYNSISANDFNNDINLNKFIIHPNEYLSRNINGFYRVDYLGYNQPKNPDYINILKNTFNEESNAKLQQAINSLKNNLIKELLYIYSHTLKNTSQEKLLLCTVPRSKSCNSYTVNQMLFRQTFYDLFCYSNPEFINKYDNGVFFINRIINTKTTHLHKTTLPNDGNMPYVGITQKTCQINNLVAGRNIVLVDDIYTKSVNVDEDVIQTLFNMGATNVTMFVIAKTKLKTQNNY